MAGLFFPALPSHTHTYSVCATLEYSPATCQLQYLPDFLAAATANGAPVDMITSHLCVCR